MALPARGINSEHCLILTSLLIAPGDLLQYDAILGLMAILASHGIGCPCMGTVFPNRCNLILARLDLWGQGFCGLHSFGWRNGDLAFALT